MEENCVNHWFFQFTVNSEKWGEKKNCFKLTSNVLFIWSQKKKEIIFLQLEIWTQKPRIHSESRGFVLNLNTSVMYLFFFLKKRKETLEINSYLKLNLHFMCQWKHICFPWSVRWSLQEMPEAKFCLFFFFIWKHTTGQQPYDLYTNTFTDMSASI